MIFVERLKLFINFSFQTFSPTTYSSWTFLSVLQFLKVEGSINNLQNPGLIYAGNKLMIPTVAPAVVQEPIQKLDQDPQMQNSAIRVSQAPKYEAAPG